MKFEEFIISEISSITTENNGLSIDFYHDGYKDLLKQIFLDMKEVNEYSKESIKENINIILDELYKDSK